MVWYGGNEKMRGRKGKKGKKGKKENFASFLFFPFLIPSFPFSFPYF
jgi:hypothetical protein